MQLVLKGDDRVVVRIDSRLDGFDDVLRRTAAAAVRRGLDLDPVTRANFEAAGLTVASPPDGGPPRRPEPGGRLPGWMSRPSKRR